MSKMSEVMKRRWQDPAYRAAMAEKMRAAHRDPEKRKRMLDGQAAAMAKASVRATYIKVNRDPEKVERARQSRIKSQPRHKFPRCLTPEEKQRRVEKMLAVRWTAERRAAFGLRVSKFLKSPEGKAHQKRMNAARWAGHQKKTPEAKRLENKLRAHGLKNPAVAIEVRKFMKEQQQHAMA